ncbi:MAG: hypothetical protein V4581_11220 [Bacteroidota bacterium]
MKKLYILCIAILATVAVACSGDGDNPNSEGTKGDGAGGSLAIFALKGNYLYTVDQQNLNVFSLVDATGPVKVNEVHIGFNIETLFSDQDYLYVGSQNGMYIYAISNPENPVFVSEAQHFTSCDPVVSNGTHAFVTLHSNTWCGNNINALMVYDLANPQVPQLIHHRELTAPKGLGLYNNYLFVCDDEIKVFDVTNPAEPVLVTSINKLCFDVIIRDNELFAIGADAVSRYALNPEDITDINLQSQVVF